MTRAAGDPPLRSSRPVATGYGPLTVTLFWGEEGQRLGLPGIPKVEASGTVLASPAVLAQVEDDWTGEIEGWLGDRSVRTLPDVALAYPRELVIVEFTDTVPPEAVSSSHFQPIRVKRSYAPDTSIVILGLLVLALPSIALARAGAAVHLNARSRRYGLLRVLGAPPRRLAMLIALDIAAPVLAGALLGSVAYAATMSSLNTFTLAGSSYWARDLVLPIALALALPLVVVMVGLLSAVRMITRTGRDPVGTLRKERKPASYLTYLSSAGVVAGPAAMFWASNADFTLSAWLIMAGMLLSVVGLEGLSRTAVAASGRLLADWTRAQVAGSRMYRGGAEAVLGVSATSVAVLLIVFSMYANIDNRASATGEFDVLASLPTLMSPESVVRAMEGIDGVTRVVSMERVSVEVDGNETRVFMMTCDDVRGSVELDASCVVGNVYLAAGLARRTDVDRVTLSYGEVYPGAPEKDPSIPGTYTVGGQVTAPWFTREADDVVLIVEEQPVTNYTILLVTTDGEPGSLRRVIEGFRDRPEESYITTWAALTSGVTDDQLVILPLRVRDGHDCRGHGGGRAALCHHAALPPAPGGVQGTPLFWRDPDAAGRRPRAAVRGPADTCLRAGRRLRHHPGRELQRGVRRPRLAGKPAGNSRPGLRPGDRRSRNRSCGGQSHSHTAARVGPRRHDFLTSSRFRHRSSPVPIWAGDLPCPFNLRFTRLPLRCTLSAILETTRPRPRD